MKFKNSLLTLLIAAAGHTAQSQTVSVQQYLKLVGQHNLDYAAHKFNVSISEAGIETARIFPDPELSIEVFDNQQSKLKLGQGISLGLGTTLELGGKRNARIKLAKSEMELNKVMLEDHLRNLRADAAIAYYEAILQRQLLEVQQNSYLAMKQLAEADSIRYKLGSITQTDARQSKLEANSLKNAIYQGEADWKNAILKLGAYCGKKNPDSSIIPDGDFEHLNRQISLQDLLLNAQNNRADARVAQNSKIVANRQLSLITANRTIDLGIRAGLQFNGASTNEEAPTPYHRAFTLGLSTPLKFSNRNKGELKAAQFSISQTALSYEAILQQIGVEVTQTYYNYLAAQKKVGQYQNGMLAEAAKIRDARVYSYKRGESSLLEVLNAQRTYNDIQQDFYESQTGYANSLIELERAAGIWDLE